MKSKLSLVLLTSLSIFSISTCKGSVASKSQSKSDFSSVSIALNVKVENGYLVYTAANEDPKFKADSWAGEVVTATKDLMNFGTDGVLVAPALEYRVKAVVDRVGSKAVTCTSDKFSGGIAKPLSFTCDGPVKDDVAKEPVATNLTCQCLGTPRAEGLTDKTIETQVADEKLCTALNSTSKLSDFTEYVLSQCKVTVKQEDPAPAAMSCSCDVYEAQEYYRVGSRIAEILRNEKVDLAKYSGKQSCSDINEKFADDKNVELYANCK